MQTSLADAMDALDKAVQTQEIDIFTWWDLKRRLDSASRKEPMMTKAQRRHKATVDHIGAAADKVLPVKHFPSGRRS
jgi:hypothetical protein